MDSMVLSSISNVLGFFSLPYNFENDVRLVNCSGLLSRYGSQKCPFQMVLSVQLFFKEKNLMCPEHFHDLLFIDPNGNGEK